MDWRRGELYTGILFALLVNERVSIPEAFRTLQRGNSMNRYSILISMLLLGFLAVTCQSPTNPDPQPIVLPRILTADEAELLSSTDHFGLKLFRALANQQPDKNIFISPLSVSMALGMTANGAATSTLEAIRNVLELGGLTEEESNAAYKSLVELFHLAPRYLDLQRVIPAALP
jgi:serine protease inhibitor